MKSVTTRPLLAALAGAAVLGLLVPTALAHGGGEGGHGGHGGMEMTDADKPRPEEEYPLTYFAHPDHKTAIYAHIALMVLAWVFMLPVGVMLSIARSRYRLLAQFAFLVTNVGGMLVGIVYNASTPDLYPNNAHHKLGWVVTWLVGAQFVIGLLASVAGVFKKKQSDGSSRERQGFMPVSTQAMEEHNSHIKPADNDDYRFSNDSGQGTEPSSDALRSSSRSSSPGDVSRQPLALHDVDLHTKEYDDGDDSYDVDSHSGSEPLGPMLPASGKAVSTIQKIAGKISERFWKVLILAYNVVDRAILPLGFVALCTGIVTYGRFFEGAGIFNGLAHWIKGGIFFWLGIFTLGRWAGCFGEVGWAWNVRPKQTGQKWRPSAEFVESALIFTYGATNIFLEHLGHWGGAWSASDLEHFSITVLFIGGGLCGMLIESVRIRDLLNTTVTDAAGVSEEPRQQHHFHDVEVEDSDRREPETYSFSINPIPALVILLLGIMMSSHTQDSMISSMVHKQWGNLLTGASFARGFTYVITYLKPPRSVYPSRPPTELLAAFGLISGGIIFMASASDTVSGMIHYQLDAMFMYTVTMGLVGLLMAWVILCIALKGWAVRKETGRYRK
ncbi:hypothetical protein B0H65DRAFT_165742 [Neurospora tetraspora]|uniref:Integral membrane protein n=1 Tax=Neurospora tetraspora TaxID=94610 RepID=A0AAE0MT10_9PEZI|nr:hypothetical protein B0H65DRAFT_165742 [Neurospora tetraspora]